LSLDLGLRDLGPFVVATEKPAGMTLELRVAVAKELKESIAKSNAFFHNFVDVA